MGSHTITGDVHSCAQAQASLDAAGPAFNDLCASMDSFVAALDTAKVEGDTLAMAQQIQSRYADLSLQAAECAAEFGELVQIQRDSIPPELRHVYDGTWFDFARM